MFAFVITSAAVEVNNVPHSLCEGDVWDAADPVVKQYPSFFADAPKKLHRTTSTSKPAKKAAARKG